MFRSLPPGGGWVRLVATQALQTSPAGEVIPSPRPFLDHEQWVKLRKLDMGVGCSVG